MVIIANAGLAERTRRTILGSERMASQWHMIRERKKKKDRHRERKEKEKDRHSD
jgi:hypothetical protein